MLDRYPAVRTTEFDEFADNGRRFHPDIVWMAPLEREPFRGSVSAITFSESPEGCSILESISTTTGFSIEHGETQDVRLVLPTTMSLGMGRAGVTRGLPTGGLPGLMPASGVQGRAGPGQTLMLRLQGRRVADAMRQFDFEGDYVPVLDRNFLEPKLPGLTRLADNVRHVVACVDGDTDMIVNLPGFRAAHEQVLLLRIGEILASAAQPERKLRLERGSTPLRRALDYVKEHADGLLDLSVMSRYAGVSLRSLQLMFRRDLDTTITEHIQRERLSRVRERLERAGAGQTISEIARASGFNHLGEFARLYARTFHELPSETLRRTRQRD